MVQAPGLFRPSSDENCRHPEDPYTQTDHIWVTNKVLNISKGWSQCRKQNGFRATQGVELNSAFQNPGFHIPQAKISRIPGKCPPTPPLNQHFALSEK